MNPVDMGPPDPEYVTTANMVRAEMDHRTRCLECSEGVRDCYKLTRLLKESMKGASR